MSTLIVGDGCLSAPPHLLRLERGMAISAGGTQHLSEVLVPLAGRSRVWILHAILCAHVHHCLVSPLAHLDSGLWLGPYGSVLVCHFT